MNLHLIFYENNMKWEIRYYLTENAHRNGVAVFKEVINGNRDYAIKWAQNKCKNSEFVAYDLIQK